MHGDAKAKEFFEEKKVLTLATLANGNWAVLRPINDPSDIEYGEIYYIEYGDYRTFKRLISTDKDDEVTL
jgi:hypothetical protein